MAGLRKLNETFSASRLEEETPEIPAEANERPAYTCESQSEPAGADASLATV